ncbi:MAG: hypothetical protein VKO64_06160 [Candidatus Sericytochromatia bacterium]|nr:hypothetical protein [Candidatus Sericytochromatia bacterium]
MHVTLLLTERQSETIYNSWHIFEAYDNPSTVSLAGGVWCTDDGGVHRLAKDAAGRHLLIYDGPRSGAAAFAATGVDFETLPVLAYRTSTPDQPWWQKPVDEEKERNLAWTKTELFEPKIYGEPTKTEQGFPGGLLVKVWWDEPYYFLAYLLDGEPVANQAASNYLRELAAIEADPEAFIKELQEFRRSRQA